MMVQLDDRALLDMPILLLPAANRQHMIEADGGILLPELQHGLQIAGREPDIDDALRQLHRLTVIRTRYPSASRKPPKVLRPLPCLALVA